VARIYAVGVGPGDPELLTRKAERILRQVPVICAPAASAATRAMPAIVEPLTVPVRVIVSIFRW
jgi:precorrin-2/cobalt-factor-2 C20-methyltransferase